MKKEDHTKYVSAIASSNDNKYLETGSPHKTIKILN